MSDKQDIQVQSLTVWKVIKICIAIPFGIALGAVLFFVFIDLLADLVTYSHHVVTHHK